MTLFFSVPSLIKTGRDTSNNLGTESWLLKTTKKIKKVVETLNSKLFYCCVCVCVCVMSSKSRKWATKCRNTLSTYSFFYLLYYVRNSVKKPFVKINISLSVTCIIWNNSFKNNNHVIQRLRYFTSLNMYNFEKNYTSEHFNLYHNINNKEKLSPKVSVISHLGIISLFIHFAN